MQDNLNKEGMMILESDKVQLKPYIPRPFKKIEYMSDDELMKGVDGTLMVDCECYPNYFLIAFKDVKTQKIIKLEAPFNARLLSWIMHNYRTVGFNSIKYDMPMIWLSYHWQNLENLHDLSKALIYQNLFPHAAAKEWNFKIFPTNHIDLIEVAPLRGSLKLYGARLHAQRIQDLPFDPHQPISEEQKEIVANYCFNDLDSTELMLNNLTEQLTLRIDLSSQYKYDMLSKSDAQIAEAVIGNELKALTGTWPKRPTIDSASIHQFNVPNNMRFQTAYMQKMLDKIASVRFSVDMDGRLLPSEVNKIKIQLGNSIYRMGIGGLHSSEETRVVKADDNHLLIDKDVGSYYPAIVLNLNLYPQHLGENFLKVYRMLRDRRMQAKKAKQIAISECLKICINGTFGKTGSPYSFLYAPEMTIQITVSGQLYLLMLIEQLELHQIPVASANTDGIVILCPHDKRDLLDRLTKQWETVTGFETEETLYEAIYSRDVNAYLAVKRDQHGKVEFKGKNDFYDPWRGKSPKDGYWRFQKNPTHQICIEAIEALISDGTPIEKTIKECRDITKFVCVKNVTGGAHKDREYLGKVIRWYIAKDVIGTINYIKSNNKVPETEGAKPCMDLPESLPSDINYIWYINKAFAMLEDIGYTKKQAQIQFF